MLRVWPGSAAGVVTVAGFAAAGAAGAAANLNGKLRDTESAETGAARARRPQLRKLSLQAAGPRSYYSVSTQTVSPDSESERPLLASHIELQVHDC